MSKSLFKIQSEYEIALRELDQYCEEHQTDEVPEGMHDRLVINQDEMSDKIQAYWHVITEAKGELDMLTAYIATMSKKLKPIKAKITRMTDYVGQAVELYGDLNKSGKAKEIKTPLVKVSVKRSSKLKVVDQSLLPEIYKEEIKTTTIKTLTASLKAALISGEEIAGAEIDDTTRNVTFK